MKVLGLIAVGGFGVVEHVRLHDGTEVARKTFRVKPEIAAIADPAKLRTRFSREVRIQAKLPADNFIPIIASDLSADPPWYTMPLADKNLEAEIAAGRKAGEVPKEALDNILESLEHLHSLQLVHRDLKPSNVLFHNGRWKLSDFGLVATPVGDTKKLTTSLTPFGTATYCAPEQIASFANVTPAADVYSFGCILHDIFDGRQRTPFQCHAGPGPLGMVIEICTRVDPSKRFKSISGLRAALFQVLSAPTSIVVDPEAKKIVEYLKNPQLIGKPEQEGIRRFIRGDKPFEELWAIFTSFDESAIAIIHKADPDLWTELVGGYLEWAKGGFDFAYCDVIARRLEQIFELGSFEIKARAALVAAELGSSHNRWYVMGRVISMCGPKLEDLVAQRVALEIAAAEVESSFRRCAAVIGKETQIAYHPVIAAQLAE